MIKFFVNILFLKKYCFSGYSIILLTINELHILRNDALITSETFKPFILLDLQVFFETIYNDKDYL